MTLFLPDRTWHDGALHADLVVEHDGKTIQAIRPRKAGDAGQGVTLLMPACTDLQVNGSGGTMLNSDPSPEGLAAIIAAQRAVGTGWVMPTLITTSLDQMRQAIEATLTAWTRPGGLPGLAGLHIEGPYLNPARKGTHDVRFMRPFDPELPGLLAPLRAEGIPVMVTLAPECVDASLPASGYRLEFGATIVMTGADTDGLRHGLIALAQMMDAAKQEPERFSFPAEGTILDAPRHGWRGCMLDVSRHFWTGAEVARLLDIMAWYRMNRFHWHLTDDEAWRIEIPALPALTEIGATRAAGTAMPPQLGNSSAPERAFYTQKEIAALVRHAGSLGIEVIPEVDMPGHCISVLTALPHLVDPDETPASYHSVQGFANNALNPALPSTWDFVATVLDDLAKLFPSRFVHIGGDEVADDAWMHSPLARELMKTEGLAGTPELQSWFMRRLKTMLAERGRTLAGWNEVAHGGGVSPEGTLLFAWQAPSYGIDLAREGYDVVMTPGQAYYLDMAQSPNWFEPGAGWAGSSTPKHSYGYEAAGDFPAELAHHLKGVQACIWCEHMHDRSYFNDLIFPRLLAVAEAAWTPAAQKDWLRFAVQARRTARL